MENEKNDKKIALERQIKDQNKSLMSPKHKEHVEKKKNAQMLEESRLWEDNVNDSSQQLQDSLKQKVFCLCKKVYVRRMIGLRNWEQH